MRLLNLNYRSNSRNTFSGSSWKMEMGYAFGTHKEMLFSTGIVLFIFIKGIRFITPNFIFSDYLSEGGEMIELD